MNISKHHKEIINSYIRAKDDSKPHLMKGVFEDSASLNMEVRTDNIAFPSETNGLDAITNLLVKDFNQTYENVYTFCISDSVITDEKQTSCKWVVVMTDKEQGNIRVGYGDYKWVFNNALASQLTIVIEKMIVLKKEDSEEIFNWINNKAYPWCNHDDFLERAPTSISFLKHGLSLQSNSL